MVDTFGVLWPSVEARDSVIEPLVTADAAAAAIVVVVAAVVLVVVVDVVVLVVVVVVTSLFDMGAVDVTVGVDAAGLGCGCWVASVAPILSLVLFVACSILDAWATIFKLDAVFILSLQSRIVV